MPKPKTLGDLKNVNYKIVSVREEMRNNLIKKLYSREPVFDGILGYDDTVIPQVENAVLAGQDMIFLGERGQAKSRIIRALVNLLDLEIPIINGCEINDNPFNPICGPCIEKKAELHDLMPISWITRASRYSEKLATPDITMADLIGDIDPIKIVEGRYLGDELTVHYGLIPRTNRGIFCINELPDLVERLQVGLFNLMEEGDIQIKGYQVRLPLDVLLVSSANPEDYTNRGRIITPLKDRYGAQIRTHYPRTSDVEIQIMEMEHRRYEDGRLIVVPEFMKEIVAEISKEARKSPDVNQRAGVSVRISISNYESLIGNALRRAIHTNEKVVVPRISDLLYLAPSTMGKLELETVEEERSEQIMEELVKNAVATVFARHCDTKDLETLLAQFKEGVQVSITEFMPSRSYTRLIKRIDGFSECLDKLDCKNGQATIASGVEFVLEGLHVHRKLNKAKVGSGGFSYKA